MPEVLHRCGWAEGSELECEYHDNEWGVPLADDQQLFEFLLLEGAQAGLSWRTVLQRRDGYRRAYEGFKPERIARWTDEKRAELLQDSRIIRNRAKIASATRNARAWLELTEQHGSFASWYWEFVDGVPVQNSWQSMAEVPATTELSDQLSKALKQQGFNFVGSTICYALMQATGMVNDHLVSCHRYAPVAELGQRFEPTPSA